MRRPFLRGLRPEGSPSRLSGTKIRPSRQILFTDRLWAADGRTGAVQWPIHATAPATPDPEHATIESGPSSDPPWHFDTPVVLRARTGPSDARQLCATRRASPRTSASLNPSPSRHRTYRLMPHACGTDRRTSRQHHVPQECGWSVPLSVVPSSTRLKWQLEEKSRGRSAGQRIKARMICNAAPRVQQAPPPVQYAVWRFLAGSDCQDNRPAARSHSVKARIYSSGSTCSPRRVACMKRNFFSSACIPATSRRVVLCELYSTD